MLYLYGPREDRGPDFEGARSLSPAAALAGLRGSGEGCVLATVHARLSVARLLMPAGLGLYMAYLALAGGDPLMPFHAQDVWGRHFAGPYLGVWDGVKAAFAGARQLLSFQRAHVYFPAAGGSPRSSPGTT